MIRGILLDLGNVLIDYRPELFVSRLAEHTRIGETDLWEYFLTANSDASYTEGRISSEEFFGMVSRDLTLTCTREEFRDFWCQIFFAKREMEPLVAKLKQSYPVWVLSNTNEWHFEFLKKNFPILNRIDRFFVSHELGCRKPDLKVYERVAAETGFKPQEIFFTDDIEINVTSAKEAGFQASLFTDAPALTRELENLGVLNNEK